MAGGLHLLSLDVPEENDLDDNITMLTTTYLLYASDNNQNFKISRLDDDYYTVTEQVNQISCTSIRVVLPRAAAYINQSVHARVSWYLQARWGTCSALENGTVSHSLHRLTTSSPATLPGMFSLHPLSLYPLLHR